MCETMITMTPIYLCATFMVRSFHIAKFKQNEPSQDLPPVFDAARVKVNHFVKVCICVLGNVHHEMYSLVILLDMSYHCIPNHGMPGDSLGSMHALDTVRCCICYLHLHCI